MSSIPAFKTASWPSLGNIVNANGTPSMLIILWGQIFSFIRLWRRVRGEVVETVHVGAGEIRNNVQTTRKPRLRTSSHVRNQGAENRRSKPHSAWSRWKPCRADRSTCLLRSRTERRFHSQETAERCCC